MHSCRGEGNGGDTAGGEEADNRRQTRSHHVCPASAAAIGDETELQRLLAQAANLQPTEMSL